MFGDTKRVIRESINRNRTYNTMAKVKRTKTKNDLQYITHNRSSNTNSTQNQG